MYTEEVDLCHRLAEAGWELWYVPAAVVTHYGEASSRQVREAMYLQLYRSKIQFYRKFGGNHRADLFKRLAACCLLAALGIGRTVCAAFALARNKSAIYRDLLVQLPDL